MKGLRVCVCVKREGWELSSAERSYAKLPWKKWSSHKLFLNRVEVLARGRDSELLAQEAALGLHGLRGIIWAFMATSEASRWGAGSAALAFRQTERGVARSRLRCQAEIVSVHTTYVSQADLPPPTGWRWQGAALFAGWGTLRTRFHHLSATVRPDQKRSGDITWLAINSILAGAKTKSKHSESECLRWRSVALAALRVKAEQKCQHAW